ncbi:hypothetical protein [Nonomuraea longicatena]|uniref:hypothetical protein n=1 Tax=Nonomuraea longicatena TaxID=83682 RepID=UPI0031DD94C1
MLVVLAIAALAILACVVLVSLGKGGELSEFPPDVPPLDLPEAGQLTAVDMMALQLPVNLVGYHTQSVDETLKRAASAISARDTRIAVLEQRVSDLMSDHPEWRQDERSTEQPDSQPEAVVEAATETPEETPAVAEAVPEAVSVAEAPSVESDRPDSEKSPKSEKPLKSDKLLKSEKAEKPVKPW